jgi:hypothetical protein
MAKMLAYVDCSYIMLSNSDPNLCECNSIVDIEAIPLGPDQPDKQKELSLKADWKYISSTPYRFQSAIQVEKNIPSLIPIHYHPQQALHAVFHPPRS